MNESERNFERMKQEAKFLNLINQLAEMYGCKVSVDLNTHIASFTGPEAQCTALAQKLCEVFKDGEVT